MNELHLQDKFLLPFFREDLGYREVSANTVTPSLIIEEDIDLIARLGKARYGASDWLRDDANDLSATVQPKRSRQVAAAVKSLTRKIA